MSGYVSAEIIGGLGNQLYIISACHILGKRLGKPVVFHRKERSWSVIGTRDTYWDTLFKNNNTVHHELQFDVVVGEKGEVIENVPNAQRIKLFGHFQNYRLHSDTFDEFRDLLFHPDVVKHAKAKVDKLRAENPGKKLVSLHFRAGDFLLLPKCSSLCGVEYYKKALKHFPVGECIFLLFSESQEMVEEYATESGIENFQYIHDEDYIEMLMMSFCDGNIVNNSTFSWWGSFINRRDKSLPITMPSCWYHPEYGASGTEYRYFFPEAITID